jgi:hypothetical protein
MPFGGFVLLGPFTKIESSKVVTSDRTESGNIQDLAEPKQWRS